MRRVFGLRSIFEGAFLVAVPVVARELGLDWPGIVAASAVGYLLVVLLEVYLARSPRWSVLRRGSMAMRR